MQKPGMCGGEGAHPGIVGSDHLPIILPLPLARTSRAALLKGSFSHVTGGLCDIDVSCPKVNEARDTFFSKAVKLGQQLEAQGIRDEGRLGDAQVEDVNSLLHKYRESIQGVVGTGAPHP